LPVRCRLGSSKIANFAAQPLVGDDVEPPGTDEFFEGRVVERCRPETRRSATEIAGAAEPLEPRRVGSCSECRLEVGNDTLVVAVDEVELGYSAPVFTVKPFQKLPFLPRPLTSVAPLIDLKGDQDAATTMPSSIVTPIQSRRRRSSSSRCVREG
jgi:hypothetical protein